MGESLNRIRFFTIQILSRLSATQKVLVAGVVVIALAMAIMALVFTSSPPYEPLFSELSPKDAGEILDKLREKNIEYRLGNGGKTVLVPSSHVYELRVEFAREGLPETGTIGYELFDKQALGVTEFQQQVTYKRALEGELSRTIRSIDGVEKAAVMIVMPKERLFEKDQKPTTASVQLTLQRKSMPRPMTIAAIAHLVANSVEGLEPENVTITDTRGRILSENRDPNGMLSMSSDQLAFRRKVEHDLEQKALAVLEKRVGPGNATVQVNAVLNWAQVEKTIQEVDPEKTVTISEETNEQSAPGSGENAGSSNSSNTITNYETSKTVQRIVEGVGNISRLSVAVMVNHKAESQTDDEGNVQVELVARDAGEMQQLEQLAKMAVGFNEDRKDQFSLVNMEFKAPAVGPEPDGFMSWDNLDDILYKALIAVVLLVAIFTVRSILKSAKDRSEVIQSEMKKMIEEGEEKKKKTNMLASAQAAAAALNEGEDEEDEEDELVMQNEFFKLTKSARNLKQEQLQNYIQQNPEVATKLIKVWLMDEEE